MEILIMEIITYGANLLTSLDHASYILATYARLVKRWFNHVHSVSDYSGRP